jgi:hypothetical protein
MGQSQKIIIYVLLALSIGMSVLAVTASVKDSEVSDVAQSLWSLAFVFLIIMWVFGDAKERKFHKPFDFGFIIYVFWPILFPWYLVNTRGHEGILIFLGFIMLWIAPLLSGIIAYAYAT